MQEKGDFILKVEGLSVSFQTTAGKVHALRNVDFAVRRGETVAIVGESGSGKSVTVKTAIGILDTNGKVEAGKALFTFKNDKGEEETIDLLTLSKKQMRQTINGKRIAMVFQDPMTSLNPTMTIGDQIMEGMIWHFKTPKKEAWKRAVELLDMVGITDPEKRMKSIDYIQKSLWAAELLGADTIVIHSGSAAKISREEAMKLSKDTLFHVAEAVGDTPIRLGIETMGKVNQLGTLEEVIEQCRVSPIYAPVVDFGHLNARNIGGAFPDADSYRRVFDLIATSLGDEYAKHLHCHFSKIEYTNAGEKKHLTFADDVFGPSFEPLAEAIVRENVYPRIICESDGTQAEDALYMKQAYQKAGGAIS